MFEITNKTKSKLPCLFFSKIKEEILGKNYDLSLVFIGNKLSQELNKKYRNKDKPANILSFPLEKTQGEIFINPILSKMSAKDFGRTEENFITFLFIHGLLHLKGYDHGSTMEKEEKKIRNKFNI